MSRNPIPPRVPPTVAAAGSEAAPSSNAQVAATSEAIIAHPDFWYRIKRYIMVVVLIGMGPWFAYDGWKGWPAENQKIADLNHQLDDAHKKNNEKRIDELNHDPLTHSPGHSELALAIQKVLAIALPILGLLFLVWTLYVSRGVYRLTGDVLNVPGHPPVDLHDVTEIDRSRWDRKGIAYLRYKTASGFTGKICLDDFVYERDPTDQIFARAEAALT
jgi:hypothetical protein